MIQTYPLKQMVWVFINELMNTHNICFYRERNNAQADVQADLHIC